MGYGRFVGRVGTLAAALGIGFAVASSPAVAWADTDDTAPSASRDDDRTESDRQPRRTHTEKSEKVANAATVEVKRQRGTDIAPEERSYENSVAGLHENEDTDEPIEVTHEVLTRSPSESPEPQPVSPVQLAIEVTPAPEAADEPETEARTLTIAPEPLSAPASPEIPGESPILLAMLAAARRPSTTESRQAAGIQSTEFVGAAPNSDPVITWASAGTPGLFSAKVTGRVRATDADRDKLSYTATAGKGTVSISSRGSLVYTPTAVARHAAAAVGDKVYDQVVVTVADGNGGTATAFVSVVIRPQNAKPTARASVAKGNPANGVVTGKINVTDRDGDAITYLGSGATTRGAVVVNPDGSFVYTPTAAAREAATSIFRRSDRFTVTVNDGHGGVRSVSVRVGIVPPSKNAGPTVGKPGFVLTGTNGTDGTVSGYVNMADPEGFGLTYSIAAGVAAGAGSLAVNAASGSFTFTPSVGAREHAHGAPGEDTIKFSIAGSDGLSSATVEVTAVISPKAPPAPQPPPSTVTYRQVTTPNFAVSARRGWCLQFVDDSVNAPSRSATAQLAYNREKANGNITLGDPPVNVWAPIFFSIGAGQYAGLGHVAWAFNHGGGRFTIRDSETQTGARGIYTSIGQVTSWFGSQKVQYLGWSTWVDGRQILQKVSGTPGGGGGGGGGATSGVRSGTATVITQVNVRNDPSTNGPIVAQYSPGQTFNYDRWEIANGFYWLSYVSYTGVRRYVAEATQNGSVVYVRGGVFH